MTVRIDARPLPHIAADHIQIEQVLVNVIRNAIEAVADCSNRERWVRIRLRHVDDEVRSKLRTMAPVFHLTSHSIYSSPSKPASYAVWGSGLSLSREMIKVHGGSLEWDATVAVGARFVLRLPCHQDPMPVTAGLPVYLVEDDAGMRDAVSLLLRGAGFEVRSYPSAEIFLSEVDCSKSICLLTDVRLPENGWHRTIPTSGPARD